MNVPAFHTTESGVLHKESSLFGRRPLRVVGVHEYLRDEWLHLKSSSFAIVSDQRGDQGGLISAEGPKTYQKMKVGSLSTPSSPATVAPPADISPTSPIVKKWKRLRDRLLMEVQLSTKW